MFEEHKLNFVYTLIKYESMFLKIPNRNKIENSYDL